MARNDVIMTSLPKTMENADFRETKQIIYHSKGIDESYPKMYFLLNLSLYVKSYGHSGKCHFLPGGRLLKIGGASGTLSKIKRGDQKIFSN